MLRAEHISVTYGAHRALEDVSVRLEAGEVVVILGANGAGKSTLLKAIARLVRSAPGAVIAVNDNDLGQSTPNSVVEKGLALVPEGRGIFADLTVSENLALGAYGWQARDGSAERLTEVLRLFPRLAERRNQVVRTMSGGEQQMVAIGRALMSNPTILMLDEPSLGLSPLLSAELFRALAEIRDSGVGILLVEQNARLSLAIADRAYLLENGRIVGEGSASALAHDPAVQKAYLGGAGSATHRRFGEEDSAMPLTLPLSDAPESLADRAARIQREHIEARRSGGRSPATTTIAPVAAPAPVASTATSTAADLSRNAVDLARRAAEVLAAHVAGRRATLPVESASSAAHQANGEDVSMPIPAVTAEAVIVAAGASDLSRDAAILATRAAGILAAHTAERRDAAIAEVRAASPPKGKKSKSGKPGRKSKKSKR